MDKRQTAVEWLVEQIFNDIDLKDSILKLAISQAKEMEKQQIIDSNNIGYSASRRDTDETAEQYYTSTYGQ